MSVYSDIIDLQADSLMFTEDFSDDNLLIINKLIKQVLNIRYKDFADFKKQVTKIYNNTFKEIKQLYITELGTNAGNISDELNQVIRAGNQTGKRVKKLTTQKLESIVRQSVFEGEVVYGGNPLTERLRSFMELSRKKVLGSVKQGINQGLSAQQIARKIRPIVGDSKNAADRIARTTANAVGNDTLLNTYKANDELIKGVMHSTTLDSRTCTRCASGSDKVYRLGKQPYTLPLHPRCRCVWVPIMYGDKPIEMTYAKWFEGTSDKRKLKILGPTRYELYKQGKVKINDFATDLKIKRLDQLPKPD